MLANEPVGEAVTGIVDGGGAGGAASRERSCDRIDEPHELLLDVPETEVSKVRELVREEMVGAYPLDPALGVDIGVGDDWAEAKS